MNIPNLKAIKIIADIGKRIFSKQYEIKILADCFVANSGIEGSYSYKNLDLIYLLLNQDSRTGKVFWDAFTTSYLNKNDKESPFTLSQVIKLLELVSKNAKQKKSKEDQDLYENLTFYISTMNLIKHSSKTHITDEASIDLFPGHGAIAFTNIDEDHKKRIINKHKDILTRAVLLINGITPSSSSIYRELIGADQPSKKDLSILRKHGLLCDASTDAFGNYNDLIRGRNYAEMNSKSDIYLEQALQTISQLKALMPMFESQKSADEIEHVFYEKANFELLINYYANKTLSKQEGSLSNLLKKYFEANPPKSISPYGKRLKLEVFEKNRQMQIIEMLSNFNPTIIILNAIRYLIRSLEARIKLREDDNFIGAKEIALIAGLDNERTVLNDAREKDSALYEEHPEPDGEAVTEIRAVELMKDSLDRHMVDFFSISEDLKPKKGTDDFDTRDAREWLVNDKRQHPYEEIGFTDFEEEIKLETIKEIYESLT